MERDYPGAVIKDGGGKKCLPWFGAALSVLFHLRMEAAGGLQMTVVVVTQSRKIVDCITASRDFKCS